VETLTKTVQLYPKQTQFRQSNARYRAFCGGRGTGKSFVGAYDFLRRLTPGGTYLVGSPTGILLLDTTFPTLKKIAEQWGVWGPCKLTPYPTATILLEGGTAEVRFRTADEPNRMRGANLRGVWLDEASLMQKKAYDVVIASLRDGLHVGWLSSTFTPTGPTGWVHEVFATGKPDTSIVRARTSENPFVGPEFHKTLQRQYGETNWARQELGGEFVQLEGTEFPAVWLLGEDLWFNDWPDDLILKVIALDPSKGSAAREGDFQAHTLIGVQIAEDGRFVFYVEGVLLREGITLMCERTVKLCQQFGSRGRIVDSVVVEENGTMGLIYPAMDHAAAKAKYVLPYICRNNSENKEFRIRSQCSPPLSRRQVRFRRTPGTRLGVGQLQSFPLDEHDDFADSLSTGLKRVAELLKGV
jgi:phage terminase large subunit-like protein